MTIIEVLTWMAEIILGMSLGIAVLSGLAVVSSRSRGKAVGHYACPIEPDDWAEGPEDPPDGYVTEDRAEEMFTEGLVAMREMLARSVEQGGDPIVANSMRLSWNSSWGVDPGRPEEVQGSAWG